MAGMLVMAIAWLFWRRRSVALVVADSPEQRTVLWLALPLCLLSSMGMADVAETKAPVTDVKLTIAKESVEGEHHTIPLLAAATGINESSYTFKRRVYVGVGAGISDLSPDLSLAPSMTLVEDGGAAAQFTLGLDVSRHFSVELHASTLSSAEFSPNGRIDYEHAGVSALLYLGRSESKKTRQGFMGFV